MMAKAMIGVEIRSTQRRVRDVILNLPGLQPLYGIDGAAVDAQLEIERGGTGRCQPDAAELRSRVHAIATPGFYGGKVSIERKVIAAVVDDDQISKTAELVGVVDRTWVDRFDRRAFECANFDAISDRAGRPIPCRGE